MPIGSYGNPSSRSTEVDVVTGIYEAFARRDVEAALPYISDAAEIAVSGTAKLTGRAEPYRGHDGVRQYFADAARVWDDLLIHADDIRSAAGGVVVFGHVDARRDGETIRRRAIWTWQVRDGMAVAMRVNDLGAAPLP